MVDETLILRKLSELDEYYQQAKEYSAVNVEKYAGDWKIQRIIERTLQMMIETCVDVAGHIISERGFRIPKSYSDAFLVLKENNILSGEIYASANKMAKFRNVVVNHYDKVDAEIVVAILRKNLDDFIRYRDAIIRFLNSEHAH